MTKTAKGSEWRVWDFHAHTPASYLWKGTQLRGLTGAQREALVKQTVDAMRSADPDVYVVMDYWTFDGYLAIRKYAQDNQDSLGDKQVFPGIELRVESSLNSERLNVHLVLDPRVQEQVFVDVLAELKVSLRDGERGISEQCFIQYARELGADKLDKHSFDQARVQSDDAYALYVGWQTAEVTPQSIQRVLDHLKGNGLLLLPWDTYGGLRGIDFAKHYAEVRRFMRAADVFECKDTGCRAAFHGQKNPENAGYFDNFWNAIEKTARLCVRGTDAHSLADYGNFPSGMKTWIKAAPTFRGLLQTIREPHFRSYIGGVPPKKAFVEANGRLFMSRLRVNRRPGANVTEKWFDGVDIELNPDLVAIIGNKGSGKSGLAEVLALAGNSKSKEFFTFLNDKRFLSGSVPRASAFETELTWENGDVSTTTLAQDPRQAKPERVKYISQSYFEDLCNEHVAGNSDRFGAEIRKVLFTNMDPTERLDFQTLDEYLKAKEQPAEERIIELRARLHSLNKQLLDLETQASATYGNELKDKLAGKELALRDLDVKKPSTVDAPQSILEQPQGLEQVRLAEIARALEQLDAHISHNDIARRRLAERRNALSRVTERLQLFTQQTTSLDAEFRITLSLVGIDVSPVIEFSTKLQALADLSALDLGESEKLVMGHKDALLQRTGLVDERSKLQEKLDAPSKAYQEHLVAKQSWEKARIELIGAPHVADTIEYYKGLLTSLEQIPSRKAEFASQQVQALRDIHAELISIAESRRALFAPVERVMEQIPSIKDDLNVAFQSNLFFNRRSFSEKFFQLVKQNTGGFRGDEEGPAKLNDFIRRTDFSSADSVAVLMQEIRSNLIATSGSALLGIQQIMRAGKTSDQLYDLLFGLSDLEAKFSLSLAGTTIQQMSPGQRGALLLIFYLLVDSDQSPLILDQPEENLDNQTVYSMLVPIIQRAKNKRQIVMVTHNANLAVCCDAEQIVYAEFDRANDFALSYKTGAIEEAGTNSAVVDVLEGTEPAFGNRRDKYFIETH